MATRWDTVGWPASSPQHSCHSGGKCHRWLGWDLAARFGQLSLQRPLGGFRFCTEPSFTLRYLSTLLRAASMTSHLHRMQPETIKLPLLLGMSFKFRMRLSRECPTHPWLQLPLPSQAPVLKAGEKNRRLSHETLYPQGAMGPTLPSSQLSALIPWELFLHC